MGRRAKSVAGNRAGGGDRTKCGERKSLRFVQLTEVEACTIAPSFTVLILGIELRPFCQPTFLRCLFQSPLGGPRWRGYPGAGMECRNLRGTRRSPAWPLRRA